MIAPTASIILITEYDDLVGDTEALLLKILNFYGIPGPHQTLAAPPEPGRWKFRAGPSEDWRVQFDPTTLTAATGALPVALATRFRWN